MNAREYVTFHPVILDITSMERSIGFGAKFDCKYDATPNPIKIIPNTKHIHSPTHVFGITLSCSKKSHVSIPAPVISDVNKAKYSNLFLSAKALPITIVNPTTISQLPTVRPNVRCRPTRSESNGDAPNFD